MRPSGAAPTKATGSLASRPATADFVAEPRDAHPLSRDGLTLLSEPVQFDAPSQARWPGIAVAWTALT
jgi:hypothetical protein